MTRNRRKGKSEKKPEKNENTEVTAKGGIDLGPLFNFARWFGVDNAIKLITYGIIAFLLFQYRDELGNLTILNQNAFLVTLGLLIPAYMVIRAFNIISRRFDNDRRK